ncbi:Calcium-binding protein CAST [Capsicum annuum]|uniref:Calcium-binding protein CAST n=1 Tax=Capsicum annuum TaxID=4072 RepID=A0A2G2Y9D3_CAPAN|nr:Calcium-binding protein CAST [Capsicum annuum]
MTRKAPKQTGAHQKQLDILAPTCAVYELRIIDVFDRNHDNLISIDELSKTLNLLRLDIDLFEIEFMVKSYIKQENTGLRFEDFEALHRSLNGINFILFLILWIDRSYFKSLN